ncbi:MAG: hypothetical protein JWL95_2796 [Gemmatimonadetes bacterium]|nr:hypothetical protein [Gemmatimonadota bacterium]
MDDGERALTLPWHSRSSLHRARCLATLLALGALGLLPAEVRGQTTTRPDSLSPDSLAARLARAEAAIAVLRQQLATESQSTVHTRSRLQLELTGRILTNAFMTLGRSNNVDVPLVALAPSNVVETNAFGVTARQSRIGGVVSVTEVLGGVFVGDLNLDFFGGVQNGPGDRRLFPEPRLRTTRARLRWTHTEIMAGLDDPLISQLNPVSIAASGVPNFSGTGNLWNWLGQVRVSQEIGTTTLANAPVRWTVQGAAMSPYGGAQYPGEPDAEDAGERSARPAFEARIQSEWGDTARVGATDASIGDGGGEIGVGVHHGWVANGDGGLETSRAIAMDARISLTRRLELRGEAYIGRLVRGLGGGGIGQAFGRSLVAGEFGPPIRDKAGWGQLNAQVLPSLLVGSGCGLDVADEADRPTRVRNTVCAAHLLWRPSEPIVIGFELRGVSTRYDTGATGRATHLNLGLGFEL